MPLVSEQVIPIPLSDEKRAELRAELADVAIDVDRHDEELTLAKGIHKVATMQPKKRIAEIKKNIRQGFIEERRRVHEYIDDEDATIEFVDADTGESLLIRDLTLEERTQYAIPFNVGRHKNSKKGKKEKSEEPYPKADLPNNLIAE